MRLTKQFFKAARVYGAESYIKGFSGYVCELLTIYYGSFLNCVKALSKIKEKELIDIKKYYKNKNVYNEINKSKLTSPIIVIDPVQKNRNAVAALSHEKFDMLRKRAKEFQKNPSKKFFEIDILTEQDIKKKFKKNKLLILRITPLKRKRDVAGAKMVKAFNCIEQNLTDNGFKIINSDVLWDIENKALFYYALKGTKLSKTVELIGPPLKSKQHVLSFKKKHKKTFTKNKRIFAIEKRKFTDSHNLVKNLIKTPNIKDNINNIELI
jgi:tRNA nucleotidyltransferase (CCA-adding enzyme)